jgi:hypothetical protein
MEKNNSARKNLVKLILDVAAFIGFLLALDPRSTGIAIHEWLTIAGTAAIVLHLLLNWNWIVGITRNFFRKSTTKTRLNYILNWLFFIDGVVVMLSGIMISEVVLPAFGIRLPEGSAWRQWHSLSADLSLFILALHTALNWDWIVCVVKRYLLRPRGKKQANPEPGEVQA